MKLMLNDKSSMKLDDFLTESFRLPESYDEDDFSDNIAMDDEEDMRMNNRPQGNVNNKHDKNTRNSINGIENELTQIRKIALNVITRLADQPSSEQYLLMKKIWNTVDKAIENNQQETNI